MFKGLNFLNVGHKMKVGFEVRHPPCVSQNHKIEQQTLDSQNTTIYIYIYFFFLLWRCDPMRVMASLFLRFLDHT